MSCFGKTNLLEFDKQVSLMKLSIELSSYWGMDLLEI